MHGKTWERRVLPRPTSAFELGADVSSWRNSADVLQRRCEAIIH